MEGREGRSDEPPKAVSDQGLCLAQVRRARRQARALQRRDELNNGLRSAGQARARLLEGGQRLEAMGLVLLR